MKKVIKVSLVALLLLSLTACSAVFDSAISGTVKDKNASSTSSASTGGIADVMVYAYDNEQAWNNKYNSWDGKSEFKDYSVPSARTAQDGSFSISNLRWMTNNPVYGKDADSKTIYLLAFHKDYGLEKVEGRTIQSDKANNFGIIEMGKVTATKTLTISLKDIEDNTSTAVGTDSTISDTTGFSFKYTYADGYKTGSDGKFEDNVTGTISSFTNGKATIVVKYNEDNFSTTENGVTTYSVPSVTIYDIQTGSDWELETALQNGKKVITYDTEKKEYKDTDLKFSNSWKTVTVNLSLIDGSSANQDTITDPIYFKWSYDNGEEVKNGNYTTTSGSYALSVKYKKDLEDPTLVLSAFDDSDKNDDKWTWTVDENDATDRLTSSNSEHKELKVSLSDDKDSITQKVYFRKNYITLPTSGISGYLISTTGSDVKKASGYGYTDDYGDVLKLKNSSDKVISNNNVTTRQQTIPTSSTNSIVNYGYFTGLAGGVKIPVTYSNESYQGDDITLTVEWTGRPGTTPTSGSSTITINSMTTDFSNFMLYKN